MPLQLRATRLPMDQIDLDDDTFALTIPGTEENDPSLEASIARTDILHPPIVQEKGNSSYRVVAGRKRLRAVSASRTACDCLVLAANTGPANTLAVALEETCISRQPTALEKAIFLKKALQWLEEEEVAKRFLPLLGAKGEVYQLKRFLKILELEEPLLLAVHNGSLDDGVARDLGDVPFGDRMALFDLIDLLKLSVSNQKKLVSGCREMAKRHDTTIINVLDDQQLRAILAHEASNPPQKAGQLMAWLTSIRSPRLQEAEKEFRAFRGKLDLPKQVDLHHTQSFEKDTMTLEIEFANGEQLQKQWPALREIIEANSKE